MAYETGTRLERFEKRIERSSSGCWIWRGGTSKNGYGAARGLDGKMTSAHRVAYTLVAYTLYVGAITKEDVVCHKCDNPLCVKPDHLFLGTQQDNIDDMIRKGRIAKGERLNHKPQNGQNNHGSKLTWSDVNLIRKLKSEGMSAREIADKFDISKSNVYLIVSRKTWG